MKVDFHVHTNRSIDAVHSPRAMVKMAKKTGLDAIAITDHNRLFSKSEAQCLTREFGLVVIPGIEGGNIAVQKHWIALGISSQILKNHIDAILSAIHRDGGVSVAPHPHSRLGFGNYAALGFDAVESLNGNEPESNRKIRNNKRIPEIAGSDSHALPMLGYCWTEVDADETTESILEAVRKGLCRPVGCTIPLRWYLQYYPHFFRHRILAQPMLALATARQVIRDIRKVRESECSGTHC